MADAKAIVSAVDFMAAVAGKTDLFEAAPGVWVELRSLDYAEADDLVSTYGDKPTALMYHFFVHGLAKPVLTDEQKAQLPKSHPAVVTAIGGRVAEISGLGNKEAAAPPLDGGGLSDV